MRCGIGSTVLASGEALLVEKLLPKRRLTILFLFAIHKPRSLLQHVEEQCCTILFFFTIFNATLLFYDKLCCRLHEGFVLSLRVDNEFGPFGVGTVVE